MRARSRSEDDARDNAGGAGEADQEPGPDWQAPAAAAAASLHGRTLDRAGVVGAAVERSDRAG